MRLSMATNFGARQFISPVLSELFIDHRLQAHCHAREVKLTL